MQVVSSALSETAVELRFPVAAVAAWEERLAT